jgi:hypothetical protein
VLGAFHTEGATVFSKLVLLGVQSLFNAANIVLVGVPWAILAIVVVREITRGQTSADAHARSSGVDRNVAQPLT